MTQYRSILCKYSKGGHKRASQSSVPRLCAGNSYKCILGSEGMPSSLEMDECFFSLWNLFGKSLCVLGFRRYALSHLFGAQVEWMTHLNSFHQQSTGRLVIIEQPLLETNIFIQVKYSVYSRFLIGITSYCGAAVYTGFLHSLQPTSQRQKKPYNSQSIFFGRLCH